jgi:hypothetical protein
LGTSRLQIYNDALLCCKERFLSSLTENCEARRLLDNVWASNGVRYCLEQGQWQFAMRTQQIDYDPDVDTQFGYTYAFDKPTDWVLTSAVCSDERMTIPLMQYRDEGPYWFADITPMYISYVSDDENYGGDLSKWPATFCDYVAAEFASRIVLKLTGDESRMAALSDPRQGMVARRLLIAKNRAMMTQPQQRPATGAWVRSRRGNWPGYDGGNTGSLIG